MISPTLVALWLVALTFFPQSTQSCNGDCQDGYRSVCVQRGSNCKCSCIKDVASGVRALRELLHEYNVSEPTIDEAANRYREMAGSTTGEFSFTVSDRGTGEWTIRGQGLFGHVTGDAITTDTVVETANLALRASQSQPPKKIKNTKKNLRRRKRPTRHLGKTWVRGR